MSKSEVSEDPTPDQLVAFLPFACSQLCAPFRVFVKSQLQEEYISKPTTESLASKKSKATMTLAQSDYRLQAGSPRSKTAQHGSMTVSLPSAEDDSSELIILHAKTDHTDNLTELSIGRGQDIPRLLIKILSLCIPYNVYLNKLKMRGIFNGATMYETVKMLRISQITQLFLDDSCLPERNYYLVLEHQTHLQLLSLARCSLTDEDCALIIPKLAFPNPASKTLKTLILSSNFISNIGATLIAQALRNNRGLMYLNLSGNQIGDAGAIAIFKSLMEFPLTSEEIMQKRRRTLYNLKLRKEIYQKCYKQLMSSPVLGTSEERSTKSRNTNPGILRRRLTCGGLSNDMILTTEIAAARAEKMTEDLLGEQLEPFPAEETISKDSIVYSMGNLALNYLNLAYNNLGYESVLRLVELLRYQAYVGKYPDLGLVGVQLDGNAMPYCQELWLVSELLARSLQVRLLYAAPPTVRRSDRSKKNLAFN